MEKPYDFRSIEKEMQEKWREAQVFLTEDSTDKPKFYGMDFFPYPSGAGLSVGHCRNYIPTDVVCRYKRMKGFNVLHPMGWDAFGLPAENEAIKKKSHPKKTVPEYIRTYKRQMNMIGIGYDWSREINSSSPEYYKWTQWIFQLLMKRGLAYRSMSPANWCPSCKTVLANEEVVDGLCWRCDTPIEKKDLPQWFFKITDYAERLIDDLDTIDWPNSIKLMQKNWIGRSDGAEVVFKSEQGDDIVIYTTRPDTLWGASFMVLAPEHPLVEKLASADKKDAIADYRRQAERQSAIDRQNTEKEKTGIFIGACAINPVNGRRIPIWISDYVMMGYGTGAIMAVPAHDERDFEFALKFGIEMLPVIKRADGVSKSVVPENAAGDGFAEALADAKISFARKDGNYLVTLDAGTADKYIALAEKYLAEGAFAPVAGTVWGVVSAGAFYPWNSFEAGQAILGLLKTEARTVMEYYNGFGFLRDVLLHVEKNSIINSAPEVEKFGGSEAKDKTIDWLEEKGLGKRAKNFKLRDWLISRQRYWGCPIPVIHCPHCGAVPVPEEDLPVELPDVENYEPSGSGESPLANIDSWVNVKCPVCGADAKRETDTMGGFACSSWYFLRYVSPHRDDVPFDKDLAAYWLPVDLYVGGAEHAVMHLLYARFWTKVLYDAGLVPFKEPFHCLKNQGMVLSNTPHKALTLEDGSKTKELVSIFPEEAAALPEEEVTYKWVKMSKSKRNVVSPDAMAEEFGADSLRIYELFVAPFDDAIQWSNEGMIGASRFLNRVWRMIYGYMERYDKDFAKHTDGLSPEETALRRKLHKTIAKVDADIDGFKFNTAIAAIMELANDMQAFYAKLGSGSSPVFSECIYDLVLMLAPITPHAADCIWQDLGYEGFTINAAFPVFDPAIAKDDEKEIVIQILGKVKAKAMVPADADKAHMEEVALANERIQKELAGKTVVKVITVPGKLVNIVAR